MLVSDQCIQVSPLPPASFHIGPLILVGFHLYWLGQVDSQYSFSYSHRLDSRNHRIGVCCQDLGLNPSPIQHGGQSPPKTWIEVV